MKLYWKNKIINDSYLVLLLSVIVFIVCAIRIPVRTEIAIFPDETAQFAIAAYFVGYDWSEVISRTGYYSYGYALLLVPFFIIFNNPDIVYTLSLLLNALLASLLVPLSYALCKRWGIASLKSNLIFVPIILFSTLVGAVVAYSVLGLAEVALIVVIFSVTLVFYKLQEKECKYHWFSIQALLLIYGYILHQRFLGVLISGVFVLLILAVLRRIEIKKALLFFLTFSVLLTMHVIIKDNIQANLWALTEYSAPLHNDFDAVISRSTRILTDFNYFLSTLRVAVGQLFYLGVASFLLVYFAIHSLAAKNIKFILNIREQKKEFDFALAFLLFAFLLTFAISVVFMHSPRRGDHFIYGRYNTMIYPILCLYILVEIIRNNYKISKSTSIIVALFIAVTVWTDYNFRQFYSDADYLDFNTINFTVFRSYFNSNAFIVACIVSGLIGCLILALQNLKNTIVKKSLISCTLLISIVIAFSSASISIAGYHHDYHKAISSSSVNIVNKITNANLPIYHKRASAVRNVTIYELILQYRLFDRTLYLIDSACEIKHDDYYLIIASPLLLPLNENTTITFIYENEHFILYKINESDNNGIQSDDDIKMLYMTTEYILRINNSHRFESGFMWTCSQSAFLLSFEADTDYLFNINFAFQLPDDIEPIHIQFKLGTSTDIIYCTKVDSSTIDISFVVPKEKLEGQHHTLYIIGDTWTPSELFGTFDTRNLGIPILSIEAIPISEANP